jgi:hypothetical protein
MRLLATVLVAAFAAALVMPATAPARSTTALSGRSGAGTWSLLLERHRGGLCLRVRTVTPDGFASNSSAACVSPALRFFGGVVGQGNGVRTVAGAPVVAAVAGVVTATARRVVVRLTNGSELRAAARRPPRALRKVNGERLRVFGADALAIPPGARIARLTAYDARGRRVARNPAPIFTPQRL